MNGLSFSQNLINNQVSLLLTWASDFFLKILEFFMFFLVLL